MSARQFDELPALARHVVANLDRVIGRADDGRSAVVWLFSATDSAAALQGAVAEMRRRFPAERFAVTAVLPAAALVPWALTDIRPLLAGCVVLEIGEPGFVAQLRQLRRLDFEVSLGERLFVQLPRRLFLSDLMLARMAEEDSFDYWHPGDLALQQVSGGIVHPLVMSAGGSHEKQQHGGVTDAHLQFVPLSDTARVASRRSAGTLGAWYVGAAPDCRAEDIATVDEDVVFLGALPKHYGHFLLEGLTRLWFFLKPEHAHLKAVYISDPGPDRFNDVFSFFGLAPKRVVKITRPTRFRSVIVPEQSMRIQDRCHPLYKLTIDRITARIPPASHRKVYFSKEMRSNFRGIGEKPMEDVFVRNGYALFYPERLSMFETIAILKGCDSFAASSGSNAHNAVFLRDGAQCISLNRSPHVHHVQTMIDRMKGLDAVYVDAHVTLLPSSWSVGPFLFGPTRQLFEFFDHAGFDYAADELRAQFVPHLVEFLRIWGLFYNDPQRRLALDASEFNPLFDELVSAAVDTFADLQLPQAVVAAPAEAPRLAA